MAHKAKQCPNCALLEAQEDGACVDLEGNCPVCKREWPFAVLTDDEDDDAPAVPLVGAEPSDDKREEHVRKLYAILGAYVVTMRVGSAATWMQAREVVAAAERLQAAEDALAPDSPGEKKDC